MAIFDNQLRYAESIVSMYIGDVPLHVWLKSYFRDNKQMGSRDRRQIGGLVYCYYRLGHSLRPLPVRDRLLLGQFLCNEQPNDLLAYFHPEWNDRIQEPVEDKIALVRSAGIDFQPEEIFPFTSHLSDGVDHRAYCLSFLRQPDLFLRIRPGYKAIVLEKLGGAAVEIGDDALRLANGYKVEEVLTPDKEVVIQDLSSQRIATLLPETAPWAYWDACAASGGKAILVADRYPGIDITVSDIRESILQNLKERFARAGIKGYRAFTANLQRPGTVPADQAYDLVVADVPCTGSGTWSRTPEELYFFKPAKIEEYSRRQQRIITNILPHLSKGGSLVYVTCSVFKKENELIAAWMGENGLKAGLGGMIAGYGERADTMFAMRFER